MCKRNKIIMICLVIGLILSMTSVAFADSATYRGRCKIGFDTDAYLTKINDTNFWTDNYFVRLNSYNSGEPETKQYTIIKVDSDIVAQGPLHSGYSSPPYADPQRLYQGKMRLRIENRYNPGVYIYTSGAWFLTP